MKQGSRPVFVLLVSGMVTALLALGGCDAQPAASGSASQTAPATQAAASTGVLDTSRLFEDTAPAEGEDPATVEALAFDSAGSTIYGQIMVPAASYGTERPCVIMFHGFAGFTRMDDVAEALCRAGCVVVVPHHRGAWGSEGTYSFSHCIEDAVNLAAYVRSTEFVDTYGVDPDSIILSGHSMGGNTALNAAAQLDFVRAVALIAPCDIARLYQDMSDEELRAFLVDNGSDVLHTDGLDALVADVASHADSWLFTSAAERVADTPVFVATGDLDTVCPPEQMVDPLEDALGNAANPCERHDYNADHSLVAARVQLTRDLASFINEVCSA